MKPIVPLPCPCCGNTKPHVGPLMATKDGVKCYKCGLAVGVEWGEVSPIKAADRKKMSWPEQEKAIRQFYANKAVVRWNRRVEQEKALVGIIIWLRRYPKCKAPKSQLEIGLEAGILIAIRKLKELL